MGKDGLSKTMKSLYSFQSARRKMNVRLDDEGDKTIPKGILLYAIEKKVDLWLVGFEFNHH